MNIKKINQTRKKLTKFINKINQANKKKRLIKRVSEQIIMNLVSLVLGVMLFFSFVLAPMIFKVLPPDNASVFVRAIFPYYYLVNLLILSIISFFTFIIKLLF